MRFSAFSVIIVFTGLMLLGLALLPSLPVRLHPGPGSRHFSVQLSWPGVPATRVERELTSQVEAALSTMQRLEHISSVSRTGSALIRLRFHRSVDADRTRFEMAARLRHLHPGFPEGVAMPTIHIGQDRPGQQPMLSYGLLTHTQGGEAERYLERQLIPALQRIPGVARVAWQGERASETRVLYDPMLWQMLDVAGDEVLSVLDHWVRKDGQTHLADVPVMQVGGRVLSLGQLATIHKENPSPDSYHRVNGLPVISLEIFAGEKANRIRTAASVRRKLDAMQETLPPGWHLHGLYDETRALVQEMRRVGLRMLLSLGVVLGLLFLCLRKPVRILQILLAMAANLLLAVPALHLLGVQIHLHSLAGITVSFGLIVDNTIVMMEHLRRHGDKKVFVAILAATLTTMACLSAIFSLEDRLREELQDFALVLLVNLLLSLVVAWFFVPAIHGPPGMTGAGRHAIRKDVSRYAIRKDVSKSKESGHGSCCRHGKPMKLTKGYLHFLRFLRKRRLLATGAVVLLFGLPLHWLPSRLEGQGHAAGIYNKSIGSQLYQEGLKTRAERLFGGSLRLFSLHVRDKGFFNEMPRTNISIRARAPHGATIHQLNEAIIGLEDRLQAHGKRIRFETRISGPGDGGVEVEIIAPHDKGAFPMALQEEITRWVLNTGGASWQVFGAGPSFSNMEDGSFASGSRIVLEGYHYDQLDGHAKSIAEKALRHPRIHRAAVRGGEGWSGAGQQELVLTHDAGEMALRGLSPRDFHQALTQLTRDVRIQGEQGSTFSGIRLSSQRHSSFSLCDLARYPLDIRGVHYKAGGMMQLERRHTGRDIHRENQQYRLSVHYEFLGPPFLETTVREELSREAREMMPMGFRVLEEAPAWHLSRKNQWILLALIVLAVYVIGAILLESLLQPLAVIGLIPVSLCGLFLSFCLFDLGFDQGGLAACILLGGLSVNAGFFVLNDYRAFLGKYPGEDPLLLFVEALRSKLMPILLSIASTFFSLLPFVIGHREAFWFAFAAGSMGGLLFSLPALFVFFPLWIKGPG